MPLPSITKRHRLRHFRETITSGPSGGKVQTEIELGTIYGTVNPDSDFEAMDFANRNQQIEASIYCDFEPAVQSNDFLQIIAVLVGSGYRPVTDGDIYRVESVLDFQRQQRLWRIRATRRLSQET